MSVSSSSGSRTTDRSFLPRWSRNALFLAAIAVPTFVQPASAEDSILTWIVKSISADEDGDIIQASAMQVPQVGAALTTGQRISTAAGQRMVLVNGRDLVEVRANTTISIGDDDPATAKANVDVVNGIIHVEVGKRAPGQTFSIGAPYLVATVKGTKFDVSTSSEASAVTVTEGVVEVLAAVSGRSVDVTVGNTATVGRRSTGAPTLAPTPAGGASSIFKNDKNIESAGMESGDGNGGGSADGSGNDGSDSGSGGSGSGGSSGSGSSSGGAVGDTADAVGGAVGGAAGAVGDTVSDATGAVGGAVGGPVGGAIGGLGGAVGGAIGGVGGALGGALGGLGNR